MTLEKNGVEAIKVLDHGSVRMEDAMGNDLTTVNAAKASFARRAEEFKPGHQKLVNFLGENDHTSPFRHSVMTFEVSAPMFVKNQWWKYIVGSMHDETEFHDPMLAWNESSRRYVTDEPEFYIPQWRSAPEDKKQGSGDFVDAPTANWWNQEFRESIAVGLNRYEAALRDGVAPEQARVFLPAYALYVKWWWTCSLQGALHLIEQRTAPDAQWEFQQYARVVEYMVRLKFPVATSAMLGR
jgi:thymidylate synthase (FAD)